MLDLLWFACLGAVVYRTCSQPLGRGGEAQLQVTYLCWSPPLLEQHPELLCYLGQGHPSPFLWAGRLKAYLPFWSLEQNDLFVLRW